METKGVLLVVAAVAAGLLGLISASNLMNQALEKTRGRRTIARSGGVGLGIASILAEGFPSLGALARLLLRLLPFRNLAEKLVQEARYLGYRTEPESTASVMIAALALLSLIVLAISWSWVCVLAINACFLFGLGAWAGHRAEKRREETREGIPEVLQSMKACFQTGYSLTQTIREVRQSSTGALEKLFAEVEGVLETGGSVQRALGKLREKATEPELVFLATALEIQHRTGSSMERVLEATRQSVVDEIELKRSLRTQTAQAKLSAQIVTVMPFALIGAFSLVSPGFLEPFFESPLGLALLAIALGMQALGIALVRKMLKVGSL